MKMINNKSQVTGVLRKKATNTSQFTPALNNIRGTSPAPSLFTKQKDALKNKFKQYGDKGYKPSDGTGVGH